MHPPEVKQAALRLVALGLNDCEIGRQLGIPRRTVMDWRRPPYAPVRRVRTCPRCWKASKPIRFWLEDYSELLALYLGDGCISRMGRTWRLRITLDERYPGIIRDTHQMLDRCFPDNRVDVVSGSGACVYTSVYNSHLPCLIPQHAPGKKHERRIALEAWQLAVLFAEPWRFVRGCIRSDGCAFVNRTGRHEYLSYDFSNRSAEIAKMFVFTCRLVGLRPRWTHNAKRGVWDVRINRRSDVALMTEHVGLKA
jgi:Homeodomain-like domain